MPTPHDEIRGAVARVRARWRLVRVCQAVFRAAAAASAVVAAGLLLAPPVERAPFTLAAIAAAIALVAAIAAAWFLWPVRRGPSSRRVARFIEERAPELDDRLVSAVDVLDAGRPPSSLAGPMLADAARRLDDVDLASVVPAATLARAGLTAATALVALLLVLAIGRERARDAYDAAVLALFPSRVTIQVTPGDARVRVGDPFTIDARIAGSRVPLVPRVEIAVGESEDGADMVGAPGAGFRYALGSVTAPFTYRVTAAGGLEAGPFSVEVVSPPRVQRIDVDYQYPRGLGLAPRTEEDGGDIYAPEGTTVRLRVHTDRPAASGALELAEGAAVRLEPSSPTLLEGTLTVSRNDSYRVALAGADGLASDGDVEYFIRALEDRPPDVRITEPAGDRNVTRLEEVDVAARAVDDYGVADLELVYAVGGGAEQVRPMPIPKGQTTAAGRQTIYLEELDVEPGDLVSYYVRARDVARGKRATEARSDIFFLQVRPFEQEFSLAQSQGSASGAGDAVGELVNAQKEVVAATWKLDRRAASAAGAQSREDVQAVARAEDALKTRVEQASAAFGASAMRDPRRGRPGGPEPRVPIPARPEEAAMTAASAAMGQAVDALDRLRTADALPREMEALNQLLKAQAEAKDVQITTGRGSGGRGNSNYDLSSLFDRELQRSQQTNYETPESSGQADAADEETRRLLEAIRALAERQDELVKRQREVASEPLDASARQRELERLTREQAELREQAEQLARQSPSAGQPEQSGIRRAADAMQSAANELRRQNLGGAGQSGSRALDALRDLERRLESTPSNARQGADGDARLEARQLADAERRLASELDALAGAAEKPDGADSDNAADARRRMAAEQSRLANRAEALDDTVPELAQQRLAEQMRDAAGALRSETGAPDAAGDRRTADAQRSIARALERAADRLAAGDTPGDEEGLAASRLAELRDVRDRLDEVSREIERLGQQGQAGSERAAALGALRGEYQRQLERAEQMLDELSREDPSLEASTGFTFEGQGLTLSAPGTEAFKQDFARWEALRQQAAVALERAESSVIQQLGAAAAADRLASGLEDRAPREYQDQVDAYFKAIAERDR